MAIPDGFNKTRDQQLQEIERDLEKSWKEMDREVQAEEKRLKEALLLLLLLLPREKIGSKEVIKDLKAVARIRTRMLNEIKRSERRMDEILLGVKGGNYEAPENTSKVAPGRGVYDPHEDRAAAQAATLYAGTTLAGSTQSKGQRVDMRDAVLWGRFQNILAASRDGNRHVREWAQNMIRPRGAFAAAALGVNQIKFNRNTLRLSHQAHLRQVYRQTMRDVAVNGGVNNFRLDKPPGLAIAPKGVLSSLLGRILSFAGWMAVAERLNKKRSNRSTATPFDLGLHYGDPSFLTPIPDEFLEG
jgi:hypothetical protein